MKPTRAASAVLRALDAEADPARAMVSASFFKTGKGQYGEGDRFVGVTVPAQRKIAKAHASLSLDDVASLLASPVHEARLTALLVLVGQARRATPERLDELCDFYLAHAARVNNWDLVDSSAPQIIGRALLKTRDRRLLTRLARSKNLWERRMAIVSTHAFILAGQHADTFALCEVLNDDDHDLVHKACGWMLREVGKRIGVDVLRSFLQTHAPRMPRTSLRYAIEHLSLDERKRWLATLAG